MRAIIDTDNKTIELLGEVEFEVLAGFMANYEGYKVIGPKPVVIEKKEENKFPFTPQRYEEPYKNYRRFPWETNPIQPFLTLDNVTTSIQKSNACNISG